MTLSNIEMMMNRKMGEYNLLKKSVLELSEDYKKERKRYIRAVKARDFMQEVAKTVQEKVHTQIAQVVTKGLQTVFDEPYIFKILFEKKRGKTEARLVFERDGKEVDPIFASGGGVVDVASFCLRVACIVLSKSRDKINPVLILDEPFKNVSNKYLPGIPVLLENLKKELGLQIIMITHIEDLWMGKIIVIGEESKVIFKILKTTKEGSDEKGNNSDTMERHRTKDKDGKAGNRLRT